MSKFFTYLFIVWSIVTSTKSIAQSDFSYSSRSQFSSWVTANISQKNLYKIGTRFIPELSFEKKWEKIQFDSELSFNTTGFLTYEDFKQTAEHEKFQPYRIWTRISGNHYEFRIGLQKINFGTATLLRPLMWFDRIDPRDPLQQTEGVYGLLGKYYFKNNTNIWLWALYGNNETKGWEVIPSFKNKPEFGGRVQLPFAGGETGFSFHTRTADVSKIFSDSIHTGETSFRQDKYGLDGKWDIGMGLWFEYVLKENHKQEMPMLYRLEQELNIGADYTFGTGNGLHLLVEFFYIRQENSFLGKGRDTKFTALSADYPLGLFNNLSTIVYYDWEHKYWYRFINLQRTYDFWSFYLMAFWNPDDFALYGYHQEHNLFSGKGIQIMAVYDF